MTLESESTHVLVNTPIMVALLFVNTSLVNFAAMGEGVSGFYFNPSGDSRRTSTSGLRLEFEVPGTEQ